MLKYKRPLSPHLLIYRPTLNLQRSIFHRFSALILVIVFLILVISIKILFLTPIMILNESFLIFIIFLLIFLKNLAYSVFGFHVLSGLHQLVTKV